MNAWPSNIAIHVPLVETSAASRTRSIAFRSGLGDAGLRIEDNSSIRLQLVISIAPTNLGVGHAATTSTGYTEVDWQIVDPTFGHELRDPSLPGSGLSLTAIVNDDANRRNIWIATMHCTIQTDDSEALARDIGANLGRVLIDSVRARR